MNKYTFFWGGILSQWSKTKFGRYNCCEQYMMHQKALVFDDQEAAKRIMTLTNPRDQKAAGRRVRGFDPAEWDAVKRDIVYTGNLLRAQQDRAFADTLRASAGTVIVEASPYDRIWGIGYREQDALANRSNWGQNLLGKALMQVQATL